MSETRSISEKDIVGFVMDSTRERYERLSWQGDFVDYLARVSEDPYKHTRTSYQLLRDMLFSFGTETYQDNGESVNRFKLFNDPFDEGKNCIYGLDRNIERVVRYIDASADEEGKERILLLHGPVGTAKTSIVDLMGRGLEHFTGTPDGEVYSFSWRFGKDFNSEGVGGLGFSASDTGDTAGKVNPVAVLPSQMHDHPLLLIPRPERRALLEKMFREAGILGKRPIPHKLLEGELDYNSKQIYNYLIRKYKGNWLKVMDHILVQRVQFSESAGFGVAKIPPEGNVETASQPVNIDENFNFIANLLNSVSLVRFMGKYVKGNRGLIHYSDIFKKPANYLQHLLAAVEEHRMDFSEVGSDIDCVIIGTTNIHEYLSLRQDPISKALRSRIRKVDIPYLRNYRNEEKIYRRGLRQVAHRMKIAPHTTEIASRWAVMTRLEPTRLAEDKELADDAKKMLTRITPAMKASIYAGEYPAELSEKERQRLTERVRRMLWNEHKYEGMNGVPTRVLQNLFSDMCDDENNPDGCITPFRIFDLLDDIIQQGPENHDFLAREASGPWFDFATFVAELKNSYDKTLQREIEDSIVDIDQQEMENRIRNYLRNVTAYNKKESLRNPQTGQDEEPSEAVMREVEDVLSVEDSERDFFRFKILSRATDAATGGGSVDIHELYDDIFKAVHRALYVRKRESLAWPEIQKVLEKCKTRDQLDALLQKESHEKHQDTQTLLRNLEASYGYAYECARVSVLYFIRSLLQDEGTQESDPS